MPASTSKLEGKSPPDSDVLAPPRSDGRFQSTKTDAKLAPLPKPPARKMGWDTDIPPSKFFKYWRETHKAYPDRVAVYVYRLWPRIDRRLPYPDVPANKILTNIGVHYEPLADEDDLLHHYGCGDYSLQLNDQGLHRGMCFCVTKNQRDLSDNPPILELNELVMEDPVNTSYITWAKSKGIIKDAVKENEDDMANVAAVEKLTDTISSQNEQIIEQANQRAEDAEERTRQAEAKAAAQPPPTKSLDVDAASKAMDIIAQGAKMGNDMVQAAIAKVNEISSPKAQLEVFQTMLQTAKEIAGGQVPSAPSTSSNNEALIAQMTGLMKASMDRETTLQATIMRILEDRVATAEKAMQKATESPTTQSPTSTASQDPIAQLERLMTLKDKLDSFSGGGDSSPSRGGGAGMGWVDALPKILQGIAMVGSVFVTGMTNAAVAKSGKGEMQPVPDMKSLSPAEEAPPSDQLPGSPSFASSPQPQPSGNPMNQYVRFLQSIDKPLLYHLEDESRDGADFAEWMIGGYGRTTYDAIREQGPDVLKALLQSYGPIWSVVSTIPAKFDQFLAEFYSLDEIRAREEQEDQIPAEVPEPPLPIRRVRSKAATADPSNDPTIPPVA